MLLHTTYPTPPHPGPHTPPHTSNRWIPTHPCPTLHLNIFKVKGVVGLKIFYIPPENFLFCVRGAHPTQSHAPTPCYPTHAFPHIPTHIPQCLSCNFTPPTTPHHPPTHSQSSLHISPNVCHVLHTTHPTHPSMPCHASVHISPNVCHVTSHHLPHPTPPRPTHPTPHQQPMDSHTSLPYPTLKYF